MELIVYQILKPKLSEQFSAGEEIIDDLKKEELYRVYDKRTVRGDTETHDPWTGIIIRHIP